MSRRLKTYLDDDNFFKAKKVWSEFERKQSKYFNSPQSFKDKIWNNYISSKGFITQKFNKAQRDYTTKLLTKKNGYNSQVLIKITGADKNFNQLKNHIKYISRDELLDVFINDPSGGGDIFCSKNLDEIAASFQDGIYNIPSKKGIEEDQNLKEKNEVLHMVFSMKGENNIPVDEIKNAAMKTIKEKLPNNHFILAIHNDTNNPHCHLDLKTVDCNGNRIKITPANLDALRSEFAQNLTDLGYKATNFSRKQKEFAKDKYPNPWDGHKPHHYKITGYGKAKYNFSLEDHIEESYYVKFETKQGKETILWGKHLEKLMNEHNITNGDWVRFAVTDQEAVKKKIYDKKTKKWYEKTVYKNVWDCSVEGKREIELKPLSDSEKKKSEYKILGEDGLKTPNVILQNQIINKRQNQAGVSKAQSLQNTQKIDKIQSNDNKETAVKKHDFQR